MAKQQVKQAAPASAAKPAEAGDAVVAEANTVIVVAEASEAAVVDPPPPVVAAKDWRAEIRQLADFLQHAADTQTDAPPPPTYYVLDVPVTGEPHCYRLATKPGLIRFLRGLEIKRAQLERAVYVFAGERIQITNPPRHLLFEGSRIALFAAVEDLSVADDMIDPEEVEQSSETET